MRSFWLGIMGMMVGGYAFAQPADYTPPELEGIEIEDKAGDFVPLDLEFTDQEGRVVTLEDFLEDGKPLVVQLVYFECPMLCNLVINGFVAGAKDLDWSPGVEYNVISVSFDPQDTATLAKLKQENYVQALEKPTALDGWNFLVGEPDQVRSLAEAVGFPYRYLEDQEEFSHGAGMFVLSPKGQISRTLYGISYPTKELRFSLMEASEGRLGTPLQKLVLYCFRYDASRHKYGLVAMNVMKIGGALTFAILGTFVGLLWVKDKRVARAA